MSTEKAKGVVRRNTDEVLGRDNFDVFEELFADDSADLTPQPSMTAVTRPVSAAVTVRSARDEGRAEIFRRGH